MLAITKTEGDLSENIFDRLKNIPLIDRYEAYQILDDNWSGISVDLEIIQTEGFEAAKKVDPKLIIKKKMARMKKYRTVGQVMLFLLSLSEKLYSVMTMLSL